MLTSRIALTFAMILAASSASAQTIRSYKGTADIVGTGRSDSVTVTTRRSGKYVRFDDTVAVTYRIGKTTYTKTLPYRDARGRRLISRIQFRGGSGNDTFRNQTSLPSVAYGGSGNDVLIGGDSTDTFYGETGDDRLIGNGGNDKLYGGPNSDFMDGGTGSDVLLGGDLQSDSSGESRDYEEFKDVFDLSRPVIGGTSHLDVDQERSESCTVLSSLASAAYHGVGLSERIYRSRWSNNRFAIMLYSVADGESPITVPVEFDGAWTSNDASPVRTRINGRPVGPMTGEFWPTLFQRAYLNQYVPNWKDHPVEIENWLRDGDDPEEKRGAWGRRGHALKAIVGGDNPGSYNWNDYTVGNSPSPPEAAELRTLLDIGYVLTTTTGGHVVALLDVWEEENDQWMVTVYNQRALDNYSTRGALPDSRDDGVMTVSYSDYIDYWGVVTPYSTAPTHVTPSWRLMLQFARF